MTTQTNFDFIQTPKNDEGKYECERCQTAFNDESEVCWAECGDYSKKHGVPLCAECCEDQQENWGECCDSDHEDGNHEEVKYECDNCGHKFIDEEDWSGRCDESSCHYCESEDEEQDELNAAIDASGNALY